MVGTKENKNNSWRVNWSAQHFVDINFTKNNDSFTTTKKSITQHGCVTGFLDKCQFILFRNKP